MRIRVAEWHKYEKPKPALVKTANEIKQAFKQQGIRQIIYPLLENCAKSKKVSHDVKTKIIDVIKAFDGYINEHILCS